MSKIEVNTVAPQCGTTLTLGESGDTVTLGTGASQSGFGRTGTVDWITTVQTSTITAATGKGYFVNTTGGAITANLPAGSAGSIVAFKDYAGTFQTNALTISPNGSEKIGGIADDTSLSTESQTVTLIYIDSTQGWLNVNTDVNVEGETFITATGGTITTVDTNYKVHTFTSPGNFIVSAGGGTKATVDYMIIGGGGGSAGDRGGGGGAGGYRESHSSPVSGPYTASPLATPTSMPVSVTTYPIVVGAGGAADNSPPYANGSNGSVSSGFSISSAGGGGGGRVPPGSGSNGASGGGSGNVSPHAAVSGGSGNTPPVSPPQGNDGGENQPDSPTSGYGTGGGGGAGGAGGNAAVPQGGAAGTGVTTNIPGSPVGYAGGGAGANDQPGKQGTPAGPFGGGTAATEDSATSGTPGTPGKGGGGGGSAGSTNGGNGGDGVVVIRYKFQ